MTWIADFMPGQSCVHLLHPIQRYFEPQVLQWQARTTIVCCRDETARLTRRKTAVIYTSPLWHSRS